MAKKQVRKKPAKRFGVQVSVYVDPELRAAVQDYIDAQRLPPKLTDLVELALQEFLKTEGYWPRKGAS